MTLKGEGTIGFLDLKNIDQDTEIVILSPLVQNLWSCRRILLNLEYAVLENWDWIRLFFSIFQWCPSFFSKKGNYDPEKAQRSVEKTQVSSDKQTIELADKIAKPALNYQHKNETKDDTASREDIKQSKEAIQPIRETVLNPQEEMVKEQLHNEDFKETKIQEVQQPLEKLEDLKRASDPFGDELERPKEDNQKQNENVARSSTYSHDDIEELRKDYQEVNSVLHDLQEQLTREKAEKEKIQKTIQHMNETALKLQEEVAKEKLHNEFKETKIMVQDLQQCVEKHEDLKKASDPFSDELERLQEDNQKLNLKVQKLQDNLQQNENAVGSSAYSYDDIQELIENHKEVNSVLHDLQEQLTREKAEKEEIQKALSHSKEETSSRKLKTEKAEKEEIQKAFSHSEEEMKKLKTDHEEMKEKLQVTLDRLSEVEADNKDVRSHLKQSTTMQEREADIETLLSQYVQETRESKENMEEKIIHLQNMEEKITHHQSSLDLATQEKGIEILLIFFFVWKGSVGIPIKWRYLKFKSQSMKATNVWETEGIHSRFYFPSS